MIARTRRNLPLLHVVGFASTNNFFTAAVRFLDGEAFIDYVWMIDEIDRILPQYPKILVVDCDLGLMKLSQRNGQVQLLLFADFVTVVHVTVNREYWVT